GPGYTGLHVAFVRSQFAHARIESIHVSAARAAPGVVAVVTAADLASLAGMSVGAASMPPVAARREFPESCTHFVGEPLAAVVAVSAAEADDALELVEVEYTDLPAVGSISAALAGDAPVADTALPNGSNVVHPLSQVAGDVDAA